MRPQIEAVCRANDYEPPIICTPEELISEEPMTKDAIVEEVRAAREAFAKEHHHDIDALFAALRDIEVESGREHVRLPPRRHMAPDIATQQAAAR